MLKFWVITYMEKKLFSYKESFEKILAHQVRTAKREFKKRHPNIHINSIFVEYRR